MSRGTKRRGRTRAGFLWPTILCLLGLGSGCHHRQVQPLVLPQTTPVPLDSANAPTAVLPTPPKPKLPEVPVAEAATTPKKVKRQKVPKSPAAIAVTPAAGGPSSAAPSGAEMQPVSEASAASAAAAGIGALTAGTEQDPKTKQQAAEMITDNERRLGSLPADVARAQAALVSKIRTFQRDAQQALASGDVEGARTLATKGRLLLDEMLKSGS